MGVRDGESNRAGAAGNGYHTGNVGYCRLGINVQPVGLEVEAERRANDYPGGPSAVVK